MYPKTIRYENNVNGFGIQTMSVRSHGWSRAFHVGTGVVGKRFRASGRGCFAFIDDIDPVNVLAQANGNPYALQSAKKEPLATYIAGMLLSEVVGGRLLPQ